MPGDLIVTVTLNPHPEFVKEGLDIVSSLELNIAEAALGCTVPVRSIYGTTTLAMILPGTNSGDQVTLEGKVQISDASCIGSEGWTQDWKSDCEYHCEDPAKLDCSTEEPAPRVRQDPAACRLAKPD